MLPAVPPADRLPAREAAREALARRALTDDQFRDRLRADPAAAASELDLDLAGVSVRVIQETVEEMTVVVPPPETKVHGLNPLRLRVDPAVAATATAAIQAGRCRLSRGADHITDAAGGSE
jgi:hypothetical protein